MSIRVQNHREHSFERFNGPILDREKLKESTRAALFTLIGVTALVFGVYIVNLIA